MSIIKTLLLIIGIVASVIVVFLLIPGEGREDYLDRLGSKDTQQEAVIGFFVLKEDIIPFLAEEFRKTGNSEITDTGIVKVLGKKYTSHQDPRIEELFTEVLSLKPLPIRREIYRVASESHQKAMLPIIIKGLNEDSDDIHEIVLGHISSFAAEIEKEEALKKALIDRMIVFQNSKNKNVSELAGSLLGQEIKKRVEDARAASNDFDFAKAESIYLGALMLSPENPLVNYAIGKFYYAKKKEKERGEKILSEYGFLYKVRPTETAPQIDGNLDEAMWKQSTPLKGFYKSISGDYIYRPSEVKIKSYMRYDRDYLYLGAVGYADYTRLVGKASRRDGAVWMDDCCEIYFDSNFDEQSYCQIVINYKGVVMDGEVRAGSGSRGRGGRRRRGPRSSWNGTFTSSTKFKQGEYWSVEVKFAWETFKMEGPPKPGDVWGFNFAWVKQVKPAEYAQWCPTYGTSHNPDYFGLIVFE